MTTPAAIYRDFQALIAAGAMTGNAPSGLSALLARLGTASLTLSGGQAGQTTDGAWMTGTTVFRGTSWSFTLNGRPGDSSEPADYTDLTLALTALSQPNAWTFAQAFPDTQLPKSRRAKTSLPVPLPGGGMVLGPSVVAPLVLETPAISAVNFPSAAIPLPHLSGWLKLTGSPLEHYADYLGSTRLRLDGTLDLTDPIKPILLLDAPAPGASTSFGPQIDLEAVGLRLRNDYPDPSPLPDEGAPTSAAMLYATFSADTIPRTVLDMSTPLLIGDYVWPIYLSFGDHPLTLSTGAQMLGKLVGAHPEVFMLPAGVPMLNLFGVSEMEFGLYPPFRDDGPGVAYSSIAITSTEPWDPPIPFVMIDEVGVRWMFDWRNDPTLMTASIWGTMTFGAKKARSVGAMAPVSRRSPDWQADIARASRVEGEAGDPIKVTLTIRLDIPDMAFMAYTENPIALPIADAFAAYFSTSPPDVPNTLVVSEIDFQASLPRKTYEAGMTVLGHWPVTCGNIIFNLDRLEFRVGVSQSAVTGAISGTISMTVPDSTPVQMMLGAEYPGDGHWLFTGELIGGPINLPKFVLAFLGYPYPDWLKSNTFVLELTKFSVSYGTAPGNPYRVSAGIAVSLKDTVLGIPVAMTAEATIERRKASTSGANDDPVPAMVTVGTLSGSFTISRLKLTAGASFLENEKTYTFSVSWRELTLSGATAWIGKDAGRHQILTLRLSGETLGGVVRFIVSLANPNANFRLEPPWDFLDTIELSRFALIIDPTLEQVTLTYDVNLDLAFARLDTVGIRYDRSTGTPQVNFVLTGQVLGTPYTPDKPLTWDAVDEAPPALPGKGQSLFDLAYFGMGQHVSLDNMTTYTSIADVIDAMRADMGPFDDPRKVPIKAGKMRFDPASQWLFGIDCTIMDTVTLKLVLHDPDLYGVLISLAGPDAGSLAGLSFELMYKKVTADVGVFHVRLQVPSAFRQLQFGAVSVTLGIITVDIYTNGNFLIDLGFPHNRDFSVSFGVEAGIFNGRGGLYFGVRDGSTSDRVPRISNGTFSPVIELGVGLEVGVGRSFEKGPLSAGLYVDVVVIFEGVLSWFHPSDAGKSTALYYWCRGTAGIVGKLYGSVDFKIISVSVSIEAHAYATLTLAAHQATLVELDVGVSVHARVKFLFFSISFSFGLQLQASFTIGQSSPTPWTLAPGQSTGNQNVRLMHAYAPPRRRPPHVAAVTRHAYRLQRFGHPAGEALADVASPIAAAPSAAAARGLTGALGRGNGLVAGVAEPEDDPYHLVFDKDAAIFPGGAVRNGAITLVPGFTIADVPVDWSGDGPAPPNPNPDYRISMMLIADTAVPPDPGSIALSRVGDISRNAVAKDVASTTFGQLAEGLLRWSLYALGITSPSAAVTLGALEELVQQLAKPEAANQGFTWDNLDGFFNHNLHLALSAAPAGTLPSVGATAFPMIPPLEWSSPDLPPGQAPRRFWVYQPVDSTYETEALAYFATLDARAPGSRPDLAGRLRAAQEAGDAVESMATFVFRDYCLMIARTAAQAAVDLLSAFPHVVVATDTLASIAGTFPTTQISYVKKPDDDVESVSESLGMSAVELIVLNPGIAETIEETASGGMIAITLGVTPQSIAAANPAWPIVAGKTINLGDLAVSVAAGETLATIAIRYAAALAPWLASPALLDEAGLVRAGAPLALPAFTYANPLALPVDTVAAVFWVRLSGYHAEQAMPGADWYAEAIAALNPGAIPVNGPLPATLLVPAAFAPEPPPAPPPPPPIVWKTLPGDTLDSVAGAVAATQIGSNDAAYLAWLTAVRAANMPPVTGGIALPATATLIVRPDDTLSNVRLRLLLDPADPAQQAAFVTLAGGADILAPLANVVVPGATSTTAANQTLLTLSQAYGLSLEDLGGRIQGDAGVLAVDAKLTLTVPSVPALGLDALTTALHDPAVEAGISGQVARFMLFGVRLPAPVLVNGTYRATGPMTGLYDLVGQQVTGPSPGGTDPALALTVDKGQTCDWLTFAATTVTEEESLGALAARHPQVHALNPGLARWSDSTEGAESGASLPAGMVVLTDTITSIILSIGQAELVANYPATGLVPTIQGTIVPLQLYREMQVRHGVTQTIVWRTTVAPQLPATIGAESLPGLWLLPGDLMTLAATGATASKFLLLQIVPQEGPSAVPVEVGAYAWSTLIDFDIRSVPGSPATVEVLGADTADRQRLASLLQYLGIIPGTGGGTTPAGESATLILAWQLPPSSGGPPALTTTALDATGTFLVKVNLSTETHRGAPQSQGLAEEAEPAPAPDPTFGPYFASVGDSAAFLTLLWEASVVGGGGYWLQAAGGDEPIPQAIFDQDGRAILSLLIQLKSQSTIDATKSWPVRNLFPFNNSAVVGDRIDPGSIALFAEATNPAELQRAATVPQGQVGFTLDLKDPGNVGPDGPQKSLRQLYSLIGYQLTETTAFVASQEGQPIGPAVKTGPDGVSDENIWNLMRVVPINRFAKANPLLALPPYPPPALSPYAGIPGASTPGNWVPAKTRVELWFHDIFGNASAAATDPHGRAPALRGAPPGDEAADLIAGVDVPVGYTDPLIGVGSWPCATLSYEVAADPAVAGQALLSVRTALQGAAYQPGAGEAGDALIAKAGRDLERYAAIYYQVMQPDVTAALLTSLRQAAGADPDVVAVPVAPLQSFAIGAYAFVGGMAARGRYIAASPVSIDAAVAHYGVAYDTLGTANLLTRLDAILAGPSFALPQTVMVRAGDTVAALAAAATPPVDPEDVLTDADNIVLPLMAGVELNIPDTILTVPDPSPPVLALLQTAGCSLGRLVAANAALPGLLTPGFIFECNGIQVQVDETPPGSEATLAGVTSVFNAQGLPFDATMVVSLNADRPGLFRAGAALTVNAYLAKGGDTLAVNGAKVAPAALAPLNTQTVTLFPDGTPLFLQTIATPLPVGVLLGTVAGDAGVAPGDILRHNGAAAMAAAPELTVPGLSRWPADASAASSPYTIRAGETLTDLAPLFGPPDLALPPLTPLGLATINQAMPSVIAGGQSIKVGGSTVQTVAGDSFDSVCNRFDPPVTLDALVAAIQSTPGILAAGGLLVCPPGRLGPAAAGQPGVIPADAGARFGVTPAGLLGANSGTPGLIFPGVTLRASTTTVATQATAAADSVTAILDRFRRAGVNTSIDDIVLANPNIGFLTAGAAVLLPPADALLQSPIADTGNGGVLVWRWPSAVFAIHSWLQLQRAYALADPNLAGTAADPSSVVRTRTAVAAARQGMPTDQPDGGATTLTGFATQLQTAIPALRVATGKTLAEEQQGATGTDVWAVNFSTTGIASVTVKPPLASVAGATGPQPRSFALRPLSTVLVARQEVEIALLDPATGLLSGSKTANYQGIDLEVWARSFLTDMEHVLSATYVTGAYPVNRAALQKIIDAKKTLAAAIARGLDYVLVGGDAGKPSGTDTNRASAIEALRQSLLVSLTQGYRTSAVIQYDTAATTVFSDPTARLSGIPLAKLSSLDPALKAATLSNGKISLRSGKSLVDVLVSIPDVGAHSSIAMELDYQIVELEFNVADEIDGYQRSDWLSFITPIGSGSPPALSFQLGAPLTPIPLRAYPQMPTLLDHRAVPPQAPATVAEAVLWAYEFTLRHQSAEQDQIEIELIFNEAPPSQKFGALADEDLFGQLAQYTENAAAMLDILAGLPVWRAAPDKTRLANALSSYADCAAGVATGWDAHWPAGDVAPVGGGEMEEALAEVGGPVLEVYGFAANLTADSTATYYQSLTLVRTAKHDGGEVGWPEIICFTPDGVPHPLTQEDPTACGLDADADAKCYVFPTDKPALRVPAFELLSFDFRFGGLPIASYQNATAKASVTRNAQLLGPSGAATRADFIYRTPVLSYLQPAVPFIDIAGALPIATWTYDPATCPLNAMFATIFDNYSANRSIACGVRYGYQLAPGNPPDVPALETYLPVRQTPAFTFSGDTVADICGTLATWVGINDPTETGGCWAFWIDLHSSVDPSLQRPVLRLKHVVSSFTAS